MVLQRIGMVLMLTFQLVFEIGVALFGPRHVLLPPRVLVSITRYGDAGIDQLDHLARSLQAGPVGALDLDLWFPDHQVGAAEADTV
jgi:hypothetical protein